ncbi:CesT family type III secretion system chaperone [Rhodoferax sp. TBRC 17660]|uniref:CesT family type III secretion system chaperone n=1 Tax=Rhodoferax potami TaxID=3068338 RepID=A0ABU3KSJ2_9BURK|nr:CesT family type III secretion system chaperone [Rhodoferax sp. TBRC 17660]MDT7520726.1 CesT family type III secretion system chaperone [Rhodoferax sp. TBRC 17660]
MRHTQAITNLFRALEKFGVAQAQCRADGRYSLSYDGGRRLDIHALPDGRLVLEVTLAVLPESVAARSALIQRALRFSTSRMQIRHDTLCLFADALVLQCAVPDRAGPAASLSALEHFLNSVDDWGSAINPVAKSATAVRQAMRVQPALRSALKP